MLKTYTCECGKTFDKPNNFNGHKSNCKIRLQRLGLLDEYYTQKRLHSQKGGVTHHENAVKKSAETLTAWVAAQHVCEHCGKIMTEKYGSGRFCSRACANSREFSEEAKAKKSVAIKGTQAISDGHIVKYIPKGADIPEGFLPTCYFNKTTRALKPDEKVKKTKPRTSRTPSLANLVTEHQYILQQHNTQILIQYEALLQEKAQGKVFDLGDRKPYLFAQYWAVTRKDTDLSVTRIFNKDSIFVHTLLAERLLERSLLPEEIVHHKNHIKLDNRFENIYIFDSKASHARFHYGKNFVLQIDGDRLVCKPLSKTLLTEMIEKNK